MKPDDETSTLAAALLEGVFPENPFGKNSSPPFDLLSFDNEQEWKEVGSKVPSKMQATLQKWKEKPIHLRSKYGQKEVPAPPYNKEIFTVIEAAWALDQEIGEHTAVARHAGKTNEYSLKFTKQIAEAAAQYYAQIALKPKALQQNFIQEMVGAMKFFLTTGMENDPEAYSSFKALLERVEEMGNKSFSSFSDRFANRPDAGLKR